jgi:hypothetical protein
MAGEPGILQNGSVAIDGTKIKAHARQPGSMGEQ